VTKSKKPRRIDSLKQILCDELGCDYIHSEGVFGHKFKCQQHGLYIDIYAPKRKGGDWMFRDYSDRHVCDDLDHLTDRGIREDDKAEGLLRARIHSRKRAVETMAALNPDVRGIIQRLFRRVVALEKSFHNMRDELQDDDY